jgi:flavodoxin
MRALIVYESMYGNTHLIADRIAAGFGAEDEVRVVPVRDAGTDLVDWADLLVVGGPTHAHSLSQETTRRSAREAAAKSTSHLTMDPSSDGPGVRNWFSGLAALHGKDAAAFDTRLDAPPIFTGRASKGIDHRLEHRGATLIAAAESFLVNRDNELVDGEAERAARWGQTLARAPIDIAGRVAETVPPAR